MELLIHSIKLDWPVLLPILICSILTVGVAYNRWVFYKDNNRDIVSFIRKLRAELSKNNMDEAQICCAQLGGVVGELAEEGIRILEDQSDESDFASSLALFSCSLCAFLAASS